MAAPIIITLPVTNVDKHSATSGGSIFSDGGETLSEYGVCWNTSGLPTLADPRTIDNSVSPYTGIGAVHVRAALHGHGTYNAVTGASTYNVMNYGAAGNGTTNDAPAIERAFLAAHAHSASGAASTVLFPSGKTYLVSSGWDMPTIRTNDWVGATPTVQRSGIVKMSGYGATIKYPNANPRFCWLQALNAGAADTQYKTHGNLIIEGFTIDDNYRAPSGACGDVFWIPAYYNTDNVVIRDVTMLDHVTHRTTYQQNRNVNGVNIMSNFTSRGQAHTSYITDITIERCTLYGGKPVAILVDGTGGMATIGRNPVIIDNVLLTGSYFDSCNACGSNVHIGAHACGGTLTVTGCTFNDCSDDGLEINAFDSVTITGCTFHNNRQPICHTWFSFPMSAGLPTWLISDCHYSGLCHYYWDFYTTTPGPIRSPMMPEVRKYATTAEYAPGDTRSWGNFTIEDCTMEFGVANAYASHLNAFTIGSNGVPMESLTITNCDITDVGSGGNLIYVRQGSGKGRTLPVSIHDVRWRNSTSGSYATLPLSKCTFVGAYSLSTDMS